MITFCDIICSSNAIHPVIITRLEYASECIMKRWFIMF